MNPPRDLIIIGGGEHARVIAEAALSTPDSYRLVGFVDREPCTRTAELLSVPQFWDDEEALKRNPAASFILGIGGMNSSTLRRSIATRYETAGARWATVVHETSWISPSAHLGKGSFIGAGAVINTGAKLGSHSIVNSGAIVEHDVNLGDFASVAPGVVIGGGSTIGDGAWLGLGCRIRDHIHIGQGTVVGMGAVVVKPLPANVCATGVPASMAPRKC